MADDLIAGLVIQVGADLSELEAGIETAQASLLNLAASVEDLGGKASEAGGQFGGLQDALSETKGKTEETEAASVGLGAAFGELAHGGVENLTEKLLELATALGIGVGLGELATSALEAYGNIQRATESLGALTGSAEAAKTTIEALKQMALDNALSFEPLLTANQRMVAMKFSTELITPALQAAADAARATNRDFETAANAIDRIALSGMASGRILATLGISTQQLGEAMGLAADSTAAVIQEHFRGLTDINDRLAVLVQALQTYAGLSKATAGDLIGQWTNVKNEVHFALESIGEALAPIASDLMSAFHDALPSIEAAALALTPVLTGLKDIGKAVGDLLGPLAQLMGMFLSGPNLIAIGTAFGFVGAALAALTETAVRAVLLIRDVPLALVPLSGGLEKMVADWKAGGDAMQKAWVDNFKTIAEQGDAARAKLDELANKPIVAPSLGAPALNLPSGLPQSFQDALDNFKRLYAEVEKGTGDTLALANAQKTLSDAYDELNPKQKELAGGFKDMPDAIAGSTEAQKAYKEAIKSTSDDTRDYNLQLQANAGNIGAMVGLLEDQATHLQASKDRLDAAGISSETLNRQLKDTNSLLEDMAGTWRDQVTGALSDMNDKMLSLNDGSIQWARSLDALEKATGTSTSSTGVTKAMKDLAATIPDATKAGGQFFDEVNLGVPDLSVLQTKLNDATTSLARMRDATDAEGNSLYTHNQIVEATINQLYRQIAVNNQTGQSTADLRQRIEDLTRSLQTNYDKWYAVGKQINEVITSDLTRALTDVITQTGNVADAFKQMGESIVSIILNRIIKDALQPLLTQLDQVIAKLGSMLGLGGSNVPGGGGILGTGIGIPGLGGLGGGGGAGGTPTYPDLGYGGSSTSTSALSATGSTLTGILGAVGSLGTMVSSIVSNFQQAHMSSDLTKIEFSTRAMMINFGIFLDQYWATGQKTWYAIHDALIDYVSAHIDFVLTELEAFHADFLKGVTTTTAAVNPDIITDHALFVAIERNTYNLLLDFNSFAVQLLDGLKGGTLGGGGGTGTGTTGGTSPTTAAVSTPHDAAWAAANLKAMYDYIASVEKPAQDAMKQLADIMANENPDLQAIIAQLQNLEKTPGLTPAQSQAIVDELNVLVGKLDLVLPSDAPYRLPNTGGAGSGTLTVNMQVDGQTLATSVVSYLEGSGTKT